MFTLFRRLLSGVFVGLFVVHVQTGFATLAPRTGITRLAAGEGSVHWRSGRTMCFSAGAPIRTERSGMTPPIPISLRRQLPFQEAAPTFDHLSPPENARAATNCPPFVSRAALQYAAMIPDPAVVRLSG